MRSVIAVLLLGVMGCSPSGKRTEVVALDVDDPVVDVGEVWVGSTIDARFQIPVRTAGVVIDAVKSSCGCQSIEIYERSSVNELVTYRFGSPLQGIAIDVVAHIAVESAGRKSFAIRLLGPTFESSLFIRATGVPAIELRPSRLELLDPIGGATKEAIVSLRAPVGIDSVKAEAAAVITRCWRDAAGWKVGLTPRAGTEVGRFACPVSVRVQLEGWPGGSRKTTPAPSVASTIHCFVQRTIPIRLSTGTLVAGFVAPRRERNVEFDLWSSTDLVDLRSLSYQIADRKPAGGWAISYEVVEHTKARAKVGISIGSELVNGTFEATLEIRGMNPEFQLRLPICGAFSSR